MVVAANLGWPRIGPKRELKKALEAFWAGKSPEKDLLEEARALIKQFDVPAKGAKIVFKQVNLENASPADMVKSIKEMIGGRSGPSKRAAAPTS